MGVFAITLTFLIATFQVVVGGLIEDESLQLSGIGFGVLSIALILLGVAA